VASTLKIIFAVGGIFIAGAVTGGFVSLRVADHLGRQKQVLRFGSVELGGRLAEQLQLTPEQNEKIRPILAQASEELRKVRRDTFSQTAALVAAMDSELSKELTAEQRQLLKDIRAKEEERRRQRMAERAKRNEARQLEGSGSEPPQPPSPPRAP
jgi:Spy/CpxP family protein refolding chaperone